MARATYTPIVEMPQKNLDAMFKGWQLAIRDPDSAVRAVAEAQRMLNFNDKSNDHWHYSLSFQCEMLDLLNNHVKEVSGLAGMQSSIIMLCLIIFVSHPLADFCWRLTRRDKSDALVQGD